MAKKRVAVLGLGKVGQLVAMLLDDSGFDVLGLDMVLRENFSFAAKQVDVSDKKALAKELSKMDAVVSCLPHYLNKIVVETAFEKAVHYFDLTEDVPTSNMIRRMAKNAKAVMAPHCGLAPGFIAILGASVAGQLDKIRSIELRVGALPQHPRGELGYAINWSADGLVNEYLNDCEVMRDGEIVLVPGMQDVENIVINGLALEAFTTSGGIGTMCESYKGKVQDLNYKTLRYPGHVRLMQFFFHELRLRENRALAGEILVNAKPPVNDDVVYVYAAAEGWREGRLIREEAVQAHYPKIINGTEWRAISWTTATSVAAVVEMVFAGDLPQRGFIKQEDISLSAFLKTKNGGRYRNSD